MLAAAAAAAAAAAKRMAGTGENISTWVVSDGNWEEVVEVPGSVQGIIAKAAAHLAPPLSLETCCCC
jgi:hypothetical protein